MEATNLISALAKVVDAKKSTDKANKACKPQKRPEFPRKPTRLRNRRKTYANALLYHTGSVRNTCNTLGYGGTTHSGGCVYGVVSPFPV